MKEIQNYPVGIQHFRKIRTGGYVYVDKTELIHAIAKSQESYFLSRPRRFGKSLLIDTLQCLFEGEKELFAGLWIEKHWNWQKTFPVIRISFSNIGTQDLGLDVALKNDLHKIAGSHNINLQETSPGLMLRELVEKLSTVNQIVILIDEYDKPIIDNLGNPTAAAANRTMMKNFYSVLKDLGDKIRFLLITGVSKFAQVSIFSDLNNLFDLSLADGYGTLLGISQQELEHYFPQELAATDIEEVKRWYNGYSWDTKTKVYNPFSILSFFKNNNAFRNYWFATGTPTFLINELKKHQLTHFDSVEVTENVLNNFDLERLNPYSLLFQTGYLTIEAYNHRDLSYTLRVPNQEVNFSLSSYLLDGYRNDLTANSSNLIIRLRNAFEKHDFSSFKDDLNEIFIGIDYQFWEKNQEKFYHGIIHLTFNLIGIYIQSEVYTNRGRCDAVVQTDSGIFVLEFKLNQSAQAAIDSIQERGYLDKYSSTNKKLNAIGINFDSTTRQINDVIVLEK